MTNPEIRNNPENFKIFDILNHIPPNEWPWIKGQRSA